jgi:PAS domain S-box-containing protein
MGNIGMNSIFRRMIISIFILIIYYPSFLYTQETPVAFQYITKKDGLSHGNIYQIYKDHRGFMWFCTENGLDRYDGYTIKHYRNDPNNRNSLSINYVTCISEDGEGNLWIGTKNGGLNKFDPVRELFTRITLDTVKKEGLLQETQYKWITAIIPCKRGGLWIGTRDGLFRMVTDSIKISWADEKNTCYSNGSKFIYYRFSGDNPEGLHYYSIYCLHEDRAGNLWIGFDDGKPIETGSGIHEFGALQKLMPGTKGDYPSKFEKYYYDPDKPKFPAPRYLMSIYEDRKGYLWIGTWSDGLVRFDPVQKKFHFIKNLPQNKQGKLDIYQATEDLEGNLWIASYGLGIIKFPKDQVESENPSFIQYKHNEENKESLSNNYIRTIFVDRSGIVWIGTLGGGINKIMPGYKFERYYSTPGNSRSLAVNNITAIYEDKNRGIWVGSDNYLNKFDSETKNFSRFQLKSKGKILINSICEDNSGNLLCATSYGIYRFDKEKKQFSNYISEFRDLHIPKNAHSRVFGGLNSYLTIEDQMYVVKNNKLNFAMRTLTTDPETNVMAEDDHHNLYLGMDFHGLSLYDSSYKYIRRFRFRDIFGFLPTTNQFFCFYDLIINRDNILMCGTNGGLLRWDIKNKKIDKLTEINGLANNNVYGIVADKNGYFWISTQNGLSRFNPAIKQFLNFSSDDGLQGDEFNPGIRLKSSEGKIYFGGKEGLTAFYPDSIKINDFIPPVAITDFKVFNKSVAVGEKINGDIVLTKSILNTSEIELPHYMNVISFEYAALDYSSPLENNYAYKMDGIDPDWVYVNANHRSANYSGLQPGEYKFHLKACNKYGTWNEDGVSIKITILHPFWNTLWFQMLLISILISIIILIYKLRTRAIRERNLQLSEINKNLIISEEKYKALADYTFDWEFWKGTDDNYIYVSPSVERITGYSADNFYDKSQFIFSIIHPDDLNKWKAGNDNVNETTQNHIEFRIITKDNQVKWLSHTHRAIYDSEGNYKGIRGTNRDITESVKEREEILRLAAIIQQSVETIMILNTEKVIIFVNEAFNKIFRYAKEDILHKDVLKLDIFNSPKVELINEIIGGKSAWTGKTIRVNKDGNEVIELTIISPIFNNEGRVINYVIIGKDISHEEELEKQLRQSQKMEAIGTLAGGIAHDFNNILTSILGNTQLLEKYIPKESVQKKYFERISSAVKRASGLANQILSFSRQKEIEKEYIRIGPIVKEALKLIRASLPSTIEIHHNIREDTGDILGDPVQIHQIVMNLVTNAKHAMGNKGGILSVDLDEYILEKNNKSINLPPGKYIKLMISDTGHGIDNSIIDRIFEPYFTTKDVGEGTGLGLAMVHGIVKTHNGDIFVKSEIGKGSTFTILLPIVHTSLEEKREEDIEIVGGREKILVVDDEESIADVMSEILNEYGYIVKAEYSSPEALEVFRKEPDKFDMVITDMTMPKMVGTELSTELRKIRKNIPVIVSTGYSEILDMKKIEQYEINGLIRKPIEIKTLLNMVRQILDENTPAKTM